MRVALVAPRVADTPADLASHRLAATGAALEAAAVTPHLVLYDDTVVEDVRKTLVGMDGVLVWVNPDEQGRDRAILNEMLREVADTGVMVSAHPDVIDAIGTKQVVFHTRHLGWGSDTQLYGTWEELREGLSATLSRGPRVLKRERGSSGKGVWRVESLDADRVEVRHAARGSIPRRLDLGAFLDEWRDQFAAGTTVLDQEYQPLLDRGMVRCYLVGDRVQGFGEQLVNALYPPPPGRPADEAPEPGPRLYYPPDRPDFQQLRHLMETEWVPALCAARSLAVADLPVIWDADFLYGSPDADGTPRWVLCEINVSSVYPFPDSALEPLAAETVARLSA